MLKTTHPLYKTWDGMLRRCRDEEHNQFHDYGGRGVYVCDTWEMSFDKFVEDMGPKPDPAFTLDRIDNDGPYCAENCRWASRVDQCRSRRNSLWFTHEGQHKHLKQWAVDAGINYHTLYTRLFKWGIPFSEAIVRDRKKKRLR